MFLKSRSLVKWLPWRRSFSSTVVQRELKGIHELPDAIRPLYQATHHHDLLSIRWPEPPRNILLVKKDYAPEVTSAFVEYAKHIHETYQHVSIILEAPVAAELHSSLPFPVYTQLSNTQSTSGASLPSKVDLASTLGGDGTILHASSLFSSQSTVPPILSFSMGTLGFLGEWKFSEYKRAFRELYMSGADVGDETRRFQNGDGHSNGSSLSDPNTEVHSGWSGVRGKFMGKTRGSRVLLRNRLNVGVFDPDGNRHSCKGTVETNATDTYAMNEVIIHRGRDPHLAVVDVFVGGRFLTEAVADGMIISTPTGSTAYSLSSGGSIVHPLVSSLLLTPICPRSLSFRPLVLPANTPVTLRLSEKNRGREVEMSIDGVRRSEGLGVGMELRVRGEEPTESEGTGVSGVPSVVRSRGREAGGEDSWVGGLNGLLKFNYPFGEEAN